MHYLRRSLVLLPLLLATPGLSQHQANGLKIGEVSADSAVVWTRLTRNHDRNLEGTPVPRETKELAAGIDLGGLADAVPGMEGQVRLVYGGLSLGGPEPEVTDWVTVDPERDFTYQFRLSGLEPGVAYSVRSEARSAPGDTRAGVPWDESVSSRVGATFRTAGEADLAERVLFTVVTGQGFHRRDVPAEGHQIYRHMAALAPSFFVHTGDVIYYDKPGPLAKDVGTARYKWNRMYALPLQREFHLRTSSYFLQDDHDVLKNDCWPGQTYGELTWEQGLSLFDEQTPSPPLPYRSVRWGADLEVWLLEGREFRSPNKAPDGPGKTILGDEQRRWLEETLTSSDASFRVVISATPIVGPDRSGKNDNHANVGFQEEGVWLRTLLANQSDTFSVCGDRHWQYVSEDPETGLVEFSCGPTSDAHAGGFGREPRDMHRYLRVRGGFLSVTVAREWGVPVATFRHHDVQGRVTHTERIRAGRDNR